MQYMDLEAAEIIVIDATRNTLVFCVNVAVEEKRLQS